MDYKLDIMKHTNIKLTTDGGMMPYLHGAITEAAGTIRTIGFYPGEEKDSSLLYEYETQSQFELLSEEELLEQYQEEGEVN